jgi:hypothetical protein
VVRIENGWLDGPAIACGRDTIPPRRSRRET